MAQIPEELKLAQAHGFATVQQTENAFAARPTARDELRRRRERLLREAAQLDALERALPLELPPAADEALWQLFVGR